MPTIRQIVAGLALPLVLPAHPVHADDAFLAPYLSFHTNSCVYDLVAGDFNNDGRPDVATIDETSVVSVLLGDGAGQLSAPQSFGLPGHPYGIGTGDFNGDGHLDLAVTGQPADLAVLLGAGDGTFQAYQVFSCAPLPEGSSLDISDFNLDGKLDVVVVDAWSDTGVCLLGQGNGTFQAPIPFACGDYPTFVHAGDLNSDGIPDLAIALWWDPWVELHFGLGNGTFGPAIRFNGQTGWSNELRIADLDEDGASDLIVVGYQIAIHRGIGDGTFLPPATHSWPGNDLGVEDIDGDGDRDIVVQSNIVMFGESALFGFLGNGDGTVATPPTAIGPVTAMGSGYGYGNVGIAFADFDTDGNLDAAVAECGHGFTFQAPLPNCGAVSIVRGHGDGSFGRDVDLSVNSGIMGPRYLSAADLDRDGALDLISFSNSECAFNSADGGIETRLGNGDGTFDSPITINLGPTYCVDGIVVDDFNEDLYPDLMHGDIRLGNGDGTLGPPMVLPLGGGENGPYATGDFNSDGHRDLLTNSSWYPGNGDGTFQPKIPIAYPGFRSSSATVGRINADAHDDIIGVLKNSDQIAVLLGNGSGGFTFQASVSTADGPFLAVIEDATGDNISDIVVTHSAHVPAVSVHPGNGDGTFGSVVTLPNHGYPTEPIILDGNADGHPDIAVTNGDLSSVAFYPGDGSGGFGPVTNYGAGGRPYGLVAADLNGDGRTDLATADQFTNSISVLLAAGSTSSVPEPGTEMKKPLLALYPNPSRGPILIAVEPGTAGPVRLDVLDVAGRHVRSLLEPLVVAERLSIFWDGLTGTGAEAPSGIYLLRLSANGRSLATRRAAIVR
jgi:hypothetical protein